MRAYLIDATIRTITQFDYIDGYHSPSEIISGKGRGNFTLGSGPLTPRRTKEEEDEDYHLDYLYAARGIHDAASSREKKCAPVLNRACKVKGDPKFWFLRPSTFPIPGRGLVIGVTIDGGWIDARLSLEELTARVTFTRRKFRGFQTSEAITTPTPPPNQTREKEQPMTNTNTNDMRHFWRDLAYMTAEFLHTHSHLWPQVKADAADNDDHLAILNAALLARNKKWDVTTTLTQKGNAMRCRPAGLNESRTNAEREAWQVGFEQGARSDFTGGNNPEDLLEGLQPDLHEIVQEGWWTGNAMQQMPWTRNLFTPEQTRQWVASGAPWWDGR